MHFSEVGAQLGELKHPSRKVYYGVLRALMVFLATRF